MATRTLCDRCVIVLWSLRARWRSRASMTAQVSLPVWLLCEPRPPGRPSAAGLAEAGFGGDCRLRIPMRPLGACRHIARKGGRAGPGCGPRSAPTRSTSTLTPRAQQRGAAGHARIQRPGGWRSTPKSATRPPMRACVPVAGSPMRQRRAFHDHRRDRGQSLHPQDRPAPLTPELRLSVLAL